MISVFGCMFAPDHRKAAEEIARVRKPGGRMAVCAWTPEGSIGKFFRLTTSHAPPPEVFSRRCSGEPRSTSASSS